MSDAVFPALRGLSYPVEKTPLWSTKAQQAASGKETRIAFWTYPIWQYSLNYNVLRSDVAHAEMQQLAGFFNARQGAFDSWLFLDPDDYTVTAQQIGTGNGTTTTWQLCRTLGEATEPVRAPDVLSATVYTAAYGGDGISNQLKYSQTFANAAWVKTNCTATDNAQVAPDGNTTAATISRTATGNHYWLQTMPYADPALATFTFSVWLKAGTLTGNVVLRLRDGAGLVDIATTTVTPTGSWQRCTVSGTFGASPAANVMVLVDPSNDAGSAGDSLHIWGAQLEFGLSAHGYIVTTATAYTWVVSSAGVVTFTAAPAGGAALTWSGNYYWRCRFMDDQQTLTKFLNEFWETKTLRFQSIK